MLYGDEKYKEQFIESTTKINDLIKKGKELATIARIKRSIRCHPNDQ